MLENEVILKDYYDKLHKLMLALDLAAFNSLVQVFLNTNNAGGKIILAGNGGSAAISSHVAVDLTKAAGIRATNFSDADLITCFSNDYGYEYWLENALKFYADKNDVVVLISSSGQSINMVNAAKYAVNRGLKLVTLTGFSRSNPLKELGQINLWVNSTSYNHVETVHQTWLLSIVDHIMTLRLKT
jgi:D-sedoheptulose 7-phosphate isomerase